ncbi:MAG: hypothetical protein IT365_23120 [Candidatus Hydrogenedentes bacterium]|nr:hypothetical protein [Candidatus Hydrogenedentota bacterium]
MSGNATSAADSKRIVCVDQLRGYAIFGMLIVNAKALFFEPVQSYFAGSSFQGLYDAILYQISHHRTTYSYADTIAPLFVFVVGMGMRLSWLRRSKHDGIGMTRKAMVKRYCMLVLIAFAIYAGWLWDALMDIGLAGLLAVMLIDKGPRVRVAAAFLFVAAYQCIHMFTSYGTWSVTGSFSAEDSEYIPLLVRLVPLHEELFDVSLNGGPLGPMSWVMMLLFGSIAYDVMAEKNERKLILTCIGWGVGLCALGYAFHMPWGGVKEAWPFSARYMTAPFPLWSTGLCFLQLLAFYLICDKLKLAIPTFTSVGMNPLVIYIAQSLFLDVADDFAPEQLSLVAGLLGFAVFWGIFAAVAYYMHRKKIYVKL